MTPAIKKDTKTWCSLCQKMHDLDYICENYSLMRKERIFTSVIQKHTELIMAILPNKYKTYEDGSPLLLYETVHFNHMECGDTRRRLYIKRTPKGYMFHCHNCGPKFSGFCPTLQVLPPSESAKAAQQAVDKKETSPVVHSLEKHYPSDFTQEISKEGMIWLLKYGITPEEITRYGIGWSANRGRVILPVYYLDNDKELAMWQERAVSTEQHPKYKTYVMAKEGVSPNLEIINGTSVVLVEDMLSAIKVGREYSAICLHGSHVSQSIYKKIVKYDNVFIWLDPDKYIEACGFAKAMAARGHKVYVIKSQKDPKDYNNEDIVSFIEDARSTSCVPWEDKNG